MAEMKLDEAILDLRQTLAGRERSADNLREAMGKLAESRNGSFRAIVDFFGPKTAYDADFALAALAAFLGQPGDDDSDGGTLV